MFPVIIICKSEPQQRAVSAWMINNYFNSHPVFVSMRGQQPTQYRSTNKKQHSPRLQYSILFSQYFSFGVGINFINYLIITDDDQFYYKKQPWFVNTALCYYSGWDPPVLCGFNNRIGNQQGCNSSPTSQLRGREWVETSIIINFLFCPKWGVCQVS